MEFLKRQLKLFFVSKLPFDSEKALGNVAMFHIGRCGSTVLGHMLGQHPKIYWDSEIYEPFLDQQARQRERVIHPIDYLKKSQPLSGKNRFYGFEVKFFHLDLLQIPLEEYVSRLFDLGFKHFIVLKRKNYLRTIVSSVIGHKTATWHKTTDTAPELVPVRINPEKVCIERSEKPLLDYMKDYETGFMSLNEILKNQSVLQLTYEDDLSEDPQKGYSRVLDFLDLDQRHVKALYKKSNPFRLDELVLNFDEVKKALKGGSYEWMLNA